MYKTIVALALAAAAAAVPTPQTGSAEGAKPEQSELFALAMEYEGSFLTLNGVTNGTIGNLVLSGGRASVYPGTPAYFNGTGDYKALNFYYDDGKFGSAAVYGLGVTQVRDGSDYAAPVTAGFAFQEFEWSGDDHGVISHKETAALNRFYACKDTADEGENIFLKWGEGHNGEPPAGCQETRVVQDFNVPGGKKSATS